MSAPDTNIEKQKQKHKPALSGLKISVGVVALLFVAFIIWTVAKGG